MSTRPDPELGAFLRSRRERLAPAAAGLPFRRRRRTPGLRREEVAELAGVGLAWYTAIEQGRANGVGAGVASALATALRLDPTETAYLHRLAGHAPPGADDPGAGTGAVTPPPAAVRRILAEWAPRPAYVLDRYWRIVAANAGVRRLVGPVRTGDSCLDAFDPGHRFRRRLGDWDELAAQLVAEFRVQARRYTDPGLDRIVARLRRASPEFTTLWARHEVRGAAPAPKVVEHPTAGRLRFVRTSLEVGGAADHRLVLLTPDTPA